MAMPFRRTVPLAVGGGLLGFAITYWLPISLMPGIDMILGAVPVLAVAMVAGARAGLLAGAIAYAATWLLWGHGIGWLGLTLEAAAVGALAGRLHPTAVVAGYWLLVGTPLYLGAALLGIENFSEAAEAILVKSALQELFASVLAMTLLFLAPIRGALRNRWPEVRLPVVSLRIFTATFLALTLFTVAGSLTMVQGRNIYESQREASARYNEAAASATAAELGLLIEGFANTVQVTAAVWDRLAPAERERAARRLLSDSQFQEVILLAPDGSLVGRWWPAANGGAEVGPALAALPPALRELAPGEALHQLVAAPDGQSYLALVARVPDAQVHLVGLVDLQHLQARAMPRASFPEAQTAVLDALAMPIMASPLPPAPPQASPLRPLVAAEPVVGSATVPNTDWQVRVTTPSWVLNEAVGEAWRHVLPALGLLLMALGALGMGLMMLLSRELRTLEQAIRTLGRPETHLVPVAGSFLREVHGLYRAYRRVSVSLRRTMRALRSRDAEMTLANSKLATTVDELKESDQRRTEVINTISHDIKIPLTAVRGYTELLEEEAAGALNDQQREFVQGIEENSRRVLTLLDDLLDMARLEVGRFPLVCGEVALGETVERTRRNLQPLIDRQRLNSRAEVEEGLAPVLADPNRLDQVLNNLVSNAIKFTPEGGRLTIRAFASPDGKEAVVQVTDTGLGIAPEHLPHLFERFYRVDPHAPGTGLGLAISKKLIEAMGGQIGVISEVGGGSTFWFTLPWAPVEAPARVGMG